jgi:hypothetical protein
VRGSAAAELHGDAHRVEQQLAERADATHIVDADVIAELRGVECGGQRRHALLRRHVHASQTHRLYAFVRMSATHTHALRAHQC